MSRKEEIINLCNIIYKENGKINRELCIRYGILRSEIVKYFGNILNMYKEVGYNTKYRRDIPKEEVVQDILNWHEKTGSTLSSKYRKEGKFSCCVINRLGGWINLMKELNLPVVNDNFTDDEMKDTLLSLYEEYGFLSTRLINEKAPFTMQAVSARMGNKNKIEEIIGVKNAFLPRKSSGSLFIFNFLKKHNVEFYSEYTWDWFLSCHKKHLFVDFYIPKINLAIEYDGEQHVRYSKFIHKTYDNFIELKERDVLKNKLLEEHNIKLIRINYKTSYDNIENILSEIISSI